MMLKKFDNFMGWVFPPSTLLFAIHHAHDGEAFYALIWGAMFGLFFSDWIDKVFMLIFKPKKHDEH